MALAEFKSQFLGGARPSLFTVNMVWPTGVESSGAGEKFSFDAKVAQIPGSTVNPIMVPYQGRNIKIAGDREFQPITFTIINDVDWIVRSSFEKWMNLMNRHADNVGATLPGDYQATFSISQLDRTGAVIATYVFEGGFPIEVGTIELGYEQVDQIEEFTVTMDYQWWTRAEAGIE
jgi:hypothetical protein